MEEKLPKYSNMHIIYVSEVERGMHDYKNVLGSEINVIIQEVLYIMFCY